MSNLIDRQAAIDAVKDAIISTEQPYAEDALRKLPSANPEQKWIPVTKALPRNETNVLVTVRDDSGDTPWEYTSTGWRTPDGKYWIVDYEICYGVIAWIPLLEPYRGE